MGIISRSQGGGAASAVLFDSTLGADAASIDTGANGIAQTQNILEAFVFARTDEAVTVSTAGITLNNDGSASYDRNNVGNANAAATGSNTLAATAWVYLCAGSTLAAGVFGIARLTIPGYTAALIQKEAEVTSGVMGQAAADTRASVQCWGYRQTAAITRMKVAPAGGTVLRAGSRLLILGR